MKRNSIRNELISVVVVNYNTRDILKKCLSNLEGSYSPLQVLVVDNNSSDKSSEMIIREFPDVELIQLSENIGLARGNNVGLRKARGKYVLFMGSDAFPHKNALKILAEFMNKNKDVSVCVGKVELRNKQIDKDTHRGLPTPWVAFTHFTGLEKMFPKSQLFGGYYLQYKDLTKTHDIDLCTSHFLFARKKMFNEVGEWDEDFFVYGEDVDLCKRVKDRGWRITYVPQARITHYKGVSVGIRKETQDITKATTKTKRRMVIETTEAMQKFYNKHYKSTKYGWPIIMGIRMLTKLRLLKLLFIKNVPR